MIKLCIVIPAFNEEKTICDTVNEYKKEFPDARVIVIDNNSTDSTAEQVRHVLDPVNDLLLTEYRQGKGFAVKQGLSRIEADIYVMTDADATYPASDARNLVGLMLEKRADMIVGDRITGGNYARQNNRLGHGWGNQLITYIISTLAGQRFNDILSGLRVMSRPFVTALDVRSSGFQLETELNIIASYLRADVFEVPIRYRARPDDSCSKLNTVRDGFRIVIFGLIVWIAFAPLQFFSLLAIFASGISAIFGYRVISGFLETGWTYTTTATAAAASGLVAILSLFFGLSLRILGRNDRRREIARFLEKKRQWNTSLDANDF